MALLYPERLVSHGLTQLSKDRAMGEVGGGDYAFRPV